MILANMSKIFNKTRDSAFGLWVTKPVVSLAAATLTGTLGLGVLTVSSLSAQATKIDNSPNISVASQQSQVNKNPSDKILSATSTSLLNGKISSGGARKVNVPKNNSDNDKNIGSAAFLIKGIMDSMNKNNNSSNPSETSSSIPNGSSASSNPYDKPLNGSPLNSSAPVAIDTLGWPSDMRTITSTFGPRISPTQGIVDYHTGVDFSGGSACGANTYASETGEVVAAGWTSNGYGNRIIIKHNDKVSTTYNHLSAINVKVGDKVNKGDVIAAVGTTGNSTGCHLHFEVLLDGHIYTDPMPYLIKGTSPSAPDYDTNYPAFMGGNPSNPDHADKGDPVHNPVPSVENKKEGNGKNSDPTPTPEPSSTQLNPTPTPSKNSPSPSPENPSKENSSNTPTNTTTPTQTPSQNPSKTPTPTPVNTNTPTTKPEPSNTTIPSPNQTTSEQNNETKKSENSSASSSSVAEKYPTLK